MQPWCVRGNSPPINMSLDRFRGIGPPILNRWWKHLPTSSFIIPLLVCSHLRPNRLRSWEKRRCSIALVNISARLSFVLMYLSVISPMLTRSLRKWFLILICLTRWWRDRSSDRLIVALLSHRIVDGEFWWKPMPVKRLLSHMDSFAASNATVYSASHEEVATIFCLCAFHDISPEPRVNPYPPTLLLVSRQLAQSESVRPRSSISLWPPRVSLRSRVPFK